MKFKRLTGFAAALLAAFALCFSAAGEEDLSWWQEENWGWVIRDDMLIVEEGVYCLGYIPEDEEQPTDEEDESDEDGEESAVPYVCRLSDDYNNGWMNPPYVNETFTQLQLPASLQIIGLGGLYNLPFKEVVLPEGLRRICEWSFESSDVERVFISSTVDTIEPGALRNAYLLEQIDVSPDNPHYTSLDGVLYTKDMTVLLAYPIGRTDEHFDIPAGVKQIADYAFSDAVYLQSVSVPFGVERIGIYAFGGCVELRRAALPLTLKEIGIYAFSDCISLENAVLPPSAEVFFRDDGWTTPEEHKESVIQIYGYWSPEAGVFNNAGPYLARTPSFYSASDFTTEPPPENFFAKDTLGIIAPENVEDKVNVFAEPSGESAVVRPLSCGDSVYVTDYQPGWYRVAIETWDGKQQEGFVRQQQLLLMYEQESLFTINSVRPAHDHVEYWEEKPFLPLEDAGISLPGDAVFEKYAVIEAPWILCWADCGAHWIRGFFSPADLLFTRADDGTDRTYGMVISDAPQNRLNLRQNPDRSSPSLGRYFSGTQVEIFGEKGDWYRVRVGTREGWMLKEFVRMVPVLENDSEE